MGFRLGVGGRVGPIRAGVSNRGVGGGLGPVSAGYAWRRGSRENGLLATVLSWAVFALLLGWLVVLVAILVLAWPMVGGAAFQQFVLGRKPSTAFEVGLLGPEAAWLAVLVRWGIRRRKRPARRVDTAPEPTPTAWRPWS